MVLNPIDRSDLIKAAVDGGFGIPDATRDDWLAYRSLDAPATLRLTVAEGQLVLAVDHGGVAAELGQRWPPWPGTPPAGFTAFAPNTWRALHDMAREAYRLARSLPLAPLESFRQETHSLPCKTEVERLRVERIGQDLFRKALLDFWDGRCAVTGLAEPRLLRASHIIPWADCESDAERLNVYNGLLLAPHLDAAFDAHLISFDTEGGLLFSPSLAQETRERLHLSPTLRLTRMTAEHEQRLVMHRAQLVEDR